MMSGARMNSRDPGRAPGYQGEVVDRLLPPDRRFRFDIGSDQRAGRRGRRRGDGHRRNAVRGRTPEPEAALEHGIHELRGRFAARHFVEVGIGCEACHGGSREHVDDPRVLPDFAPEERVPGGAPDGARTDGEVTRAERINRVCARCHQVLFSRYPFTWEGGQRRGDEPGGQLDHLRRGARPVAGRLRAPDVLRHLPRPARRGSARRARAAGHAGRQRGLRPLPRAVRRARGAGQARPPRSERRRRELRRVPHAAQEHGARLRAHPLPPDRPPDDPVRVERDRPLECALCHADKTVGELVDHHGALVGAQVRSRRPGRAVRQPGRAAASGHRSNGAGRTSRRWRWRRWARRTSTAAVPAIARQLVNPFPLVRYYARRALEALRGQDCAVDLDRPTHGDRGGRAGPAFPRRSRAGPPCSAPASRAVPERHRRRRGLIGYNRAPCPPTVTVKPPLVLLTGFLGAGKTTILNRVLGAQHRRRVGVIINELGRIDIDTRLVKSRSGDVMELAGGCVCHEVRVQSELWAAIAEVARRGAPRGGGAGDDRHRRALVDPRRAGRGWATPRRPSRRGSSAPSTPRRARGRSPGTKRRARRSRRPTGSCSPSWISPRPTRSWRCTASSPAAIRPPSAPAFRPATRRPPSCCPWLLDVRRRRRGRGRRTGRITTASSPPSPTATRRRCWASRCWRWWRASGPALVRAKGFVHLAGESRRGFLERAGLHTELRLGEPWGDESPATEIVLIGEGLDAGAIRRQIWACRAR